MSDIEFNEKMSFLLFESARWKILYGGRGAGKSEGIAIALILLSRTKCLRILCAREIQNSIDESVKHTIEANIISMGMEDEFTITNKQIINKKTGSRFFFMGLRYNINKVKSLGRIDICWIEEADKTSKTTLDKLSPTIRGRSGFEQDRGGPFGVGPEIWISFNPDLEDDEIYKRFVIEKDKYAPDYVTDEITGEKIRYAIVCKINYWDNKWFPPDLRMEMNVTKKASKTKYLEVWEGNTKLVLEGAIYADELREVIKSGRRGKVPYDPSKPVYTFWDLGHSDKTAIWFVQRVGLEFNIINFYQNNLKKIGHYIEHMQSLGYVYGTVYQPHDADNETLASRSIASLTRAAGYKVIVVPRPARKILGINAARTVMPLCNFDEENTSEGWQCLSRYAYEVDEEKGTFSREPEHDTPWSHGADAFQTFALSLKTEQDIKKPPKRERPVFTPQRPNSWMGHI
jgi:phage terminase large subunit